MHSRIFQLSKELLPKEKWLDISCVYEADMARHLIDYCYPTEYYEEDLNWLAGVLPRDVFKVDGRKIEIVSDGYCLFEQYKRDLLEMVQNMEYCKGESQFLGFTPFRIADRARKIINTEFLFYIDGFGDCIETSESLVSYAFNAMNGDYPRTLYVNGILNYHY